MSHTLTKTAVPFLFAVLAWAQTDFQPAKHVSPASLPTDKLLSEPGPTFRVDDASLASPLTVITYGDQRFTDPSNVRSTNPRVRRWLVNQIAEERPGALVLNGDVPLAGDVENDYQVYKQETQAWRDAHLNVYQALGNHEFHGDPAKCLENWWNAFPVLRNRRWYSVQLGSRAYIIALDSDAWLTPGSDQARWFDGQMRNLPKSVDVVFISMHHPPVADVQTHIEVDHNPRQNEIALRDCLSVAAAKCHARIIVSAGHIHNYERHIVDNVTYLVSGGGGATPYFVERTRDDLYQSPLFPNYHYVKFTLGAENVHGAMYRVSDPDAASLKVEVKDEFDISLGGR
jgi:acid phosphatase type 7